MTTITLALALALALLPPLAGARDEAPFPVATPDEQGVDPEALALLDEGRLALDTRAARILPAFDTPATADIRVEHLLRHTSGLPFSTIGGPLDRYESLGDFACASRTSG